MKNLKQNLPLYIFGLAVWITCLVFFPRVWASITLIIGILQMTSCSRIGFFPTRMFSKKIRNNF
ncbi:hypothetical protein EBS02_01665 [bacterium]|nr:hypothetical protein [bacterium]